MRTINLPLSAMVAQGFRLLGILEVRNTPCAREAILHGVGGSLAIGLLHFLSTSEFTLLKCWSVLLNPNGVVQLCVFFLQVESGGLLMWGLQASC